MATLEIARYWWALALRGAFAIVLGILLLVLPGASLAALVFVFGLWAMLDGITALAAAFTRRGGWELALEGIAGIAVGILVWVLPGTAAIALYVLATIWVFATGSLKLIAAVRFRNEIRSEFWMGLSGVISILLGVLMLVTPGIGVLVIATWLGVYALFMGFMMIAFAIHLRSAREELTT